MFYDVFVVALLIALLVLVTHVITTGPQGNQYKQLDDDDSPTQ